MQINSISQPTQLNQLKNLTNINSITSGNDATSQFSMLLENLLKNASAENSTNNVSGNKSNSGQPSNIEGLDKTSLSLQSLIRMIQMNMSSNTIGSVEDENSDDGIGNITSGGTDMSELLQIMMENQNIADSSNSMDTNLSNQSTTNNIIEPAK